MQRDTSGKLCVGWRKLITVLDAGIMETSEIQHTTRMNTLINIKNVPTDFPPLFKFWCIWTTVLPSTFSVGQPQLNVIKTTAFAYAGFFTISVHQNVHLMRLRIHFFCFFRQQLIVAVVPVADVWKSIVGASFYRHSVHFFLYNGQTVAVESVFHFGTRFLTFISRRTLPVNARSQWDCVDE